MYMRFAERAATLEIKAYTHSIKRALRKGGAFASNEASIGLVAPPGADIEGYADALKSVLEATERAKFYGHCTITVSHKGKVDWVPATDLLKSKPGVVVLMPNGVSVPAEVSVSFDEVVQVSSLSAIDLAAAIKADTQIPTTIEEAKALLAYPLDIMFLALRPGRSVAHALARLQAHENEEKPAIVPHPSGPVMENLAGFGHAKVWALELADDIRSWKEGEVEWRDVDCGLLLSGPPGTGKTMFAEATARTCGASFLSASCAKWQAEGNLSDFLLAMRKSFTEAAEKAPSILFLDEFDAVGDRTTLEGHNRSYGVQVINALLEALDGPNRRDGVVVIAATNYPDDIDPALRRPGRLDRHIAVTLPDLQARKDILLMHLDSDIPVDALDKTALATSGYSGAALAQLAKTARKRARRARRPLEAADLSAVTPPLVKLGTEAFHAACIHEAGHAIVGTELDFGRIELIAVTQEVGVADDRGGHVAWLRPILRNRSRSSYLDEIAMFLAGRAAEVVILGIMTDGAGGGPGSDLHRATDVATLVEATLGLGQGLSFTNVQTSKELETLRRSDPVLRRRVERMLEREMERAKEIVRARRHDIELVAKSLMEKPLLSGDEVRALLGQPPSEVA